MKNWVRINNFTDVVCRLRLTLVFIVAMLVLSYFVGGVLLTKLKTSQIDAFENSIPALTQAHTLESQLVGMTDLTVRLRNVTNADEAILLRVALIKQKNILRDILENGLSESGVDDMASMVRSLDRSAKKVVSSKLNMIWLDESISEKMVRLEEIGDTFKSIIDPLLAAGKTLGAEQQGVVNLVSAGDPSQSTSQYKLLEISYSLSNLLDTVEGLTTSRQDQNLDKAILSVKFRLNSIGEILSAIKDPALRARLSEMVVELRALTIADLGILDNIVEYQRFENEFNDNHVEKLDQIRIFSGRTDRIVDETKRAVDNTTSIFNKSLTRISLSLAIFGFVVLAAIAVVYVFVVERQINARMQRLTRAVTDIANGDNDRKVNVRGKDELGIIAGTLETFKDNARELSRSNTELEQFAYAASHDLKSPLRAIESLAQWTLEDSADDLPAEAKSNLEQLLVRANRLSRLQSDLLNYSRVGKPDDSVEVVDFAQLIDDIAAILDPDQHFAIQLARAPVGLSTQIVPLRQILINLITNAMKHHDRASGNIRIAVDDVCGRMRIIVADDGPGIEQEYHERIFGLFEKLESQEKVEGSGLGLSMVKKMIEGQKGSIAVVSDPSVKRGTSFVFDWPIMQATEFPELKVAGL